MTDAETHGVAGILKEAQAYASKAARSRLECDRRNFLLLARAKAKEAIKLLGGVP